MSFGGMAYPLMRLVCVSLRRLGMFRLVIWAVCRLDLASYGRCEASQVVSGALRQRDGLKPFGRPCGKPPCLVE